MRAYWVNPIKLGSRGSPSRTLYSENPIAATKGTATNRMSSSMAGAAMAGPAAPRRLAGRAGAGGLLRWGGSSDVVVMAGSSIPVAAGPGASSARPRSSWDYSSS